MVQSLSLFWPLILLAAAGIAAFVALLQGNRRKTRQFTSDPQAGPRPGTSAVVRPGKTAAVR